MNQIPAATIAFARTNKMALRNYMYAKHGDAVAMAKINKSPEAHPVKRPNTSFACKQEFEDIEECKGKCSDCQRKCDEITTAVEDLQIK